MSAFSAAAQDEDGDIISALRARVADLEAQLYAVGAGGVGSPVARQDHPEQHLDMVPEGWKLVPVEPADSQIRAAQDTWWHACNCETYWDQIYAAMLAAAPQPPTAEKSSGVEQPQGEQEPLFWYRPRRDGLYEGPLHKSQIERVRKESGGWVPLYTHPQPKPLTDEEITEITFKLLNEGASMHDFARAIERAHGIVGE